MSENSSKKLVSKRSSVKQPSRSFALKKLIPSAKRKWLWLIILPAWTYVSFWLANIMVVAAMLLLKQLSVSFEFMNQVIFATGVSIIVYILAIAIAILVPLKLWRRRTTLKDLGANDWPSWMDILITPLAMVIYFICSGILMLIMTKLFPINLEQAQELPFSQTMLGTQWQYFLAFFTLVVLAPVAEELLFRGYLYGKLRKTASVWVSVVITSLMFGVAHLWTGGDNLQWAVAIDTFALSIIMCVAREYTGALWVSVLMHMLKNGLAFYLLFVNPTIVNQLKSAILPLIGGM